MRERTPIKNLLRVGTVVLAAAACDRGPAITEGEVYQKAHTVETWAIYPWVKGGIVQENLDTQRETIGSPEPTHEVRGTPLEVILGQAKPDQITRTERFKVSIAQCPTEEPRPVEKIEAECKTATFRVSGEVFPNFQLGQHANFKQPK